MSELVLDPETGKVYNSWGQIEYYIEFNERESCILYRNIEGDIIDSNYSGEREEYPKITRLEIYKDWKYYEATDR